ncbi:MAG TPA: NADH-quinone oxidoreductase subunit A [Candidatus Limnocylindria bacterium]|nr:NADH-quinone oxidoreductase subunit A [Candidatus Limnocylindria bacterium]
MLPDYLPVLVLFVFVTGLGVILTTLPRFIPPRRPSLAKLAAYVSGMNPIGPAWKRVPIRFYVTTMLFVLFDVEVVFFFPWAVALHTLKLFGLAGMAVFAGLLLIGYAYAWRKGPLRWE